MPKMCSLKAKLALLLLVLMLLLTGSAYAAPTATPVPSLPPFDESVPVYDESNPSVLYPDQLYAQSCILINQDTGDVLFQKNADMRMNPASTTKIMTILLALEYGDINRVVTIPKEAAEVPLDSSMVPITVGEEMTFLDLLYGFMLKSGNDAGNAIAVLVAGSVDGFVDMMNDRAAELGCTNTHFVNAHGYTAEGHYTTARDMARITQEAMKFDIFRKIVAAGEYTMNPSSLRGEMIVRNSNMLVTWGSPYRYQYATGVKTGTTSAAGQCLVGSATKTIGTSSKVNLISVVFKSTVVFPHAKWQDTVRLMEYGFSQYQTYTFQQLYEMMNVVVPISGAAAGDPSGGMIKMEAVLNRTGHYERTILRSELNQLRADFESRVKIDYTHNLTAPIEEGTLIGRLTFTPENGEKLTAILVSDRAVAAAPNAQQSLSIGDWISANMPPWVWWLLGALVVCIVVLMISRMVAAAQRRKRRRLARERARARKAAQARRAAVQGNRPPQNRPPQGRPVQGRPPQNRPPQSRPPQSRPPQGRPPQNPPRRPVK